MWAFEFSLPLGQLKDKSWAAYVAHVEHTVDVALHIHQYHDWPGGSKLASAPAPPHVRAVLTGFALSVSGPLAYRLTGLVGLQLLAPTLGPALVARRLPRALLEVSGARTGKVGQVKATPWPLM